MTTSIVKLLSWSLTGSKMSSVSRPKAAPTLSRITSSSSSIPSNCQPVLNRVENVKGGTIEWKTVSIKLVFNQKSQVSAHLGGGGADAQP